MQLILINKFTEMMSEALGRGLAANEGFWNSISTEFHLLAHNRVGKKFITVEKNILAHNRVGKTDHAQPDLKRSGGWKCGWQG